MFTRLKYVTVQGVTRYTPSEFYDILGHEGVYSNTLIFWAKNRFNSKKDIPFINSYTVKLVDKNSVSIRVYEDEVVGCIEIMGSYFCFDKDGFITESAAERPKGIPKVTGLNFDEAVVFKQLNVQKQSLFGIVLEVTKLLKKYDIPVYEMNFNKNNEITLYGDRLVILLGKAGKYDSKLGALKSVYEKASEIGGTLDMKNYSEENTDIILKPDSTDEEEKKEDSSGVE